MVSGGNRGRQKVETNLMETARVIDKLNFVREWLLSSYRHRIVLPCENAFHVSSLFVSLSFRSRRYWSLQCADCYIYGIENGDINVGKIIKKLRRGMSKDLLASLHLEGLGTHVRGVKGIPRRRQARQEAPLNPRIFST